MDNKARLAKIESIYAAAQAEDREITDAELEEIERLSDACLESAQ